MRSVAIDNILTDVRHQRTRLVAYSFFFSAIKLHLISIEAPNFFLAAAVTAPNHHVKEEVTSSEEE